MTESIFTKAEIGEIAIFDLPGAFLHAWNDENVIVFMKEKLAALMVHIALQIYQIHQNNKKSKKSYT